MNTLENLYYTKDHEWLRLDGNKGYIGITDFAQHKLGDIVYIELPQEGDTFSAGDIFGVVESVKAASDLECPVAGTVVEVNNDIEDTPELVNKDAYENWFICIELESVDDCYNLMDSTEYAEFTKE